MADPYFDEPELASLYDLFNDNRRDFGFYLPRMRDAGSVLDVGCGTGSLLHQARQEGHTSRLVGLDPAPGMLAQARRYREPPGTPPIEWVRGDLATVAWRGEFDMVVMTGNVFQVFTTDEALDTALRGVRAALADGGRFLFETRNPARRAWERWTPDHAVEVTDAAGDTTRLETRVHAVRGELVEFSHTFRSTAWPDEARVSRSTLRFPSTSAVAAHLARAGLDIHAQYGDWSGGPFTEDSVSLLTVAGPAAGAG